MNENTQIEPTTLLTATQLAEKLNISTAKLKEWRDEGFTPEYMVLGDRIGYLPKQIQVWMTPYILQYVSLGRAFYADDDVWMRDFKYWVKWNIKF